MKLNTIIKTYHKNGELREEYAVDEQGQKHGTYQLWYDNGQLMIRKEYVNGDLNGTYQSWYNNGQLCERSEWVNGKRHGLRRVWCVDSSIRNIRQYNMGDLLVDVDHEVNPILIEIYAGVDVESTKLVMDVINRLGGEGRECEIRNC